MKKQVLILGFLCLSTLSFSQIINGTDTLYGHEWINYDLTYYKLKVSQDHVQKLQFQVLADAGLDITSVNPENIQLWHMGREVPIYLSNENTLSTDDYLLFWGKQNRSELDRSLYRNPDEEIPNPYYSLFNDTSIYFLCVNPNETGLRYEIKDNDLSNPPAKEAYYLSETLVEKHGYANKRKFSKRKYSHFDLGEGFINPANSNTIVNMNSDFAYADGQNARLSLQAFSSDDSHQLQIEINNNLVLDEVVDGYQVLKYEFNIDAASLTDETAIRIKGALGSSDKYHLGFAKLRYARVFDANNGSYLDMIIPASETKIYLEIDHFSGSSAQFLDLRNQFSVEGNITGDQVRVVLPASGEERRVILFDNSNDPISIEFAGVREFEPYPDINAEYIMISHSAFSESNIGNPVEAYKDYRSSLEGGNFKTHVFDIDQLYDQFAYGIVTHSLAIKNFINFAHRYWTGPRYVLLIGKGRRYKDMRTPVLFQEAYLKNFFIPTFGAPSSDILLAAKGPALNYPTIPIGRIAVINGEEVRIYLDKVKAKEGYVNLDQTIDGQLWQKRVLHLSGGGIAEQNIIKAYMKQMEETIENTVYAPEVTTVYKYSDDVVSEPANDEVFDLINDGVSLVTFFGHSSSNTLDFSVDIAEKYQNSPRYPMLIALGCSAGNLNTAGRGLAERFCLLPNKGYSHFLSTSAGGYINELYLQCQDFYEKLGTSHYGRGIGDVVKAGLEKYGQIFEIQSQQMVLFGDPAMDIYPSPGPDYVIDHSSAIFSPENISVEEDSFLLSFDIVNLGSKSTDSINIRIDQTFPNENVETVITKRILSPLFREKIQIWIPGQGERSAGLNNFQIFIDDDNEITELPGPIAEMNNELEAENGKKGIDLYIYSSAAIPLSPSNFAIINTSEFELIAGTTNIFEPERTYLLECDSTQLFNSPIKKQVAISQKGGLIKWNPEMDWLDNRVYYWRVSPDSISEESGYLWQGHSFLYNEALYPGWNQSHYFQFLSNSYQTIELNQQRRFEFIETYNSYQIDNRVWVDNSDRPSFTFNFLDSKIQAVLKSGLSISVIDPVSGEPWLNEKNGAFGDLVISKDEHYNFYFRTNTQEERATAINFLQNDIPPDHYVLIMTGITPGFDLSTEEWAADSISSGTNLFQVFESFGATKVRQMQTVGSVPYAFYFQKGNPGYKDQFEEITDYEGDIIQSWSVKSNHNEGWIRTEKIGPAKEWVAAIKDVSEIEPGVDDFKVSLYGTDVFGEDTLLLENMELDQYSLSEIDAERIPYLWFQYYDRDEVNRSAPQIEAWRINYEGFPDLVLNPAAHFVFHSDTVSNGKVVDLSIAIENISPYEADSTLMRFTHRDPSNNAEVYDVSLGLFEGFEQKIASQTFETFQKPGRNTVFLRVNPEEQPFERTFQNNVGVIPFEVLADEFNPFLDVTYDGIHIMDGDLISSTPEIIIQLEDDNPDLLLEDTSVITVYLQYQGELEERLYFNQDLQFYPASSDEKTNKAKVIYTPDHLEDGLYKLRVQGRDISGNKAGEYDYQRSFQIINETSISNVFNYPNPFVNSTQFVYTLTGDHSPEYFSIQIFTVSGRLVKEISQDDIGPLQVGKHMTDYSWDGRDEYGDKLASGVYLYRFVAKDENFEPIKHFDTGTDDFFTKGFGKMVILN